MRHSFTIEYRVSHACHFAEYSGGCMLKQVTVGLSVGWLALLVIRMEAVCHGRPLRPAADDAPTYYPSCRGSMRPT